ncbi:MAG: Fpg/Nei family DNA glycosylase [Chloroflexi bacterium]|nr:Fpg/Nei family DNA glycosylase [Chloroflexota bacterium]
MPEIPDLEGYRNYFNRRLPGLRVEAAEALIPWMIRTGGDDFARHMPGQVFRPVERRGKLILFPYAPTGARPGESGDWLVVHAMLTGRFQYCEPKHRRRSKTAFVLRLDNGMELRYFDERRMGRAYLVREEEFGEKVPRWSEMGPDVMDPALTEDGFVERLKTMRAQIKTVLTSERCIAGIGNAYSDEVLWEARIHPYRKRTDISDEELRELFRSLRRVMEWSTPIVTQLMEEKGLPAGHYRDHLRVHRKGGEPCPRCGSKISEITAGQRVTNFCRTCQE